MASSALHISLSAENVFTVGGLGVTNSMITSMVVSALLIGFGIWVNRSLENTNKPRGIQNFAEWLIETFISFTQSVTGNYKKTRLFFPIIATFFLFIMLNNWLGLLPGVGTINILKESPAEAAEVKESTTETEELVVDDHSDEVVVNTPADDYEGEEEEKPHVEKVPLFRPGTADLHMTLALGILALGFTQYYGIKFLHFSYFKKFFNFSGPIDFFVGILELFSEFAKIVSFAFRLFGNIFAGEVLLVVIAFLVPVVAPMPFYVLELFVGFIQALVFSMLALVFINMATTGHEEH